MLILVVDDDFSIRSLFEQVLKVKGHDVRIASDGKEGARLCLELNPDLIFTDMQMPLVNGDEMIACVRRRRPWLKFVAMSASTSWNLPADVRLWQKPFSIVQMIEESLASLVSSGV